MSDSTPLTVGEFDRTMDTFRAEVRDGFTRVTHRQDVANSRTNKLEASQAATHERLTGINREIRDIKRIPMARVQSDGSDGVLNLTVSKSMATWIRGGLLLAGAGLWQLVLWLLKANGHV